VLKPGLIKIVPAETQVERTFSFLVDKEYVVFGCLGGILEVKGNEIQILTNMVILDNQNPVDFLQQSKQTLVEKLQKAKDQPLEHDSLEAEIQKIDVELKLAFWKNK
jgi:F0F1-type ATP synthase epsilon subunit